MLGRALALLLAFGALAGGGGCKRRADRPGAAGASEASLEVRVPLVYVDGAPRGALAYNELPSTVKLDADHGAPLCDYFAAIGADCATLRQVDFYVGGCVFNVAAPARERADTFAFGFAGDRGGKPRLLPPLPPGEVDDILLWAHDPPGGRVRDDGRRGVRVNVDGRLVGEIKRDLLEGSLEPIAAPREGQAPRYRLLDFLAVRALDIDRIRGIDLIVRDERVVRLTPDEVATGLEFTAADPGRGEMLFYFGTASARALAVDVWAHTDPPARPIRFAAALGAATAVGGATLHAALRRAPDRR